MTVAANQLLAIEQAMIEHIIHRKRRRVMTMTAINIDGIGIGVTYRLKWRRVVFASVTTGARTIISNAGVAEICREKSVGGMTAVTLTGGRNMLTGFPDGNRAVVTTAANTDNLFVIDFRHAGKRCQAVAGLAFIAAGNMGSGLSRNHFVGCHELTDMTVNTTTA